MRCSVSLPEFIYSMVVIVSRKYDIGVSGAIRLLIVEGYETLKQSGKIE